MSFWAWELLHDKFTIADLPGLSLVFKLGFRNYMRSRGQAGTDVLDSCYWERLSNAVGQYYFQVVPSSFAFSTACDLVRVGD